MNEKSNGMRIAAIANVECTPAACPQAVQSLHSQISSTGLNLDLRPQEEGNAPLRRHVTSQYSLKRARPLS